MRAPQHVASSLAIREAALAAHRAGVVAIPFKADGSKAPALPWEKYQKRRPTEDEHRRWFGEGTTRRGLGFVCGEISGGLEPLDFDERDAWVAFRELAEASRAGDLVARIADGYLARTPRGMHLIYRCEEIAGNQPLARRRCPEPATCPEHAKQYATDVKSRSYIHVLIETRGEGGVIIAPPSHGGVHPSGEPYVQESGGPESIVTITAEERSILHGLARALDEMPPMEPSGAPARNRSTPVTERVSARTPAHKVSSPANAKPVTPVSGPCHNAR